MARRPVRRSQRSQPASTLRNWLTGDANKATELHADPNADASSERSEATRPPHPTPVVHLTGDGEKGESDDDLTESDPLILTDRDSQDDDTDGDGVAGTGGRPSAGGGTCYPTSSGDTLPHRMGGTHSIPDLNATGQEAAPGACALDTSEMTCHEPARTPSLSTPSATHSPLPVSAGTSLSSSAHSPPRSSLLSHWDIGHPSLRSKPYDMSGNGDDLAEDGNEVGGGVAECYSNVNDYDVGEDGDDEEDDVDALHDGDYVDEDADDMI